MACARQGFRNEPRLLSALVCAGLIEWAATATSAIVKGFGCWPLEGQRGEFGGRRPKASKGGNRAQGTEVGAAGAMGI
jgi:hypothetical protein